MTTARNTATRLRRLDLVRDEARAVLSGEAPERRSRKLEAKADAWSRWLRTRMTDDRLNDPTELLPDAFARLEQINEDQIHAAIHEFKAFLRKALT
jgi:hypothetical protein